MLSLSSAITTDTNTKSLALVSFAVFHGDIKFESGSNENKTSYTLILEKKNNSEQRLFIYNEFYMSRSFP